jgi:signal transduction histidine kinase
VVESADRVRAHRAKPELLLAGSILLAHVVVSLTMKESLALSTFADLVASALLTGVAALVIWNAVRSKGRQEIFWAVFSGGVVLWAVSQYLWTYFEVILRQDVPDPFWGDVVVFIHVVPFMAALAARPHLHGRPRGGYIATIDFALLLLWWVYLYLIVVIPWQYVSHDNISYGTAFNILYISENVVFLCALALLAFRTMGKWRSIYAQLCAAEALYLIASALINAAIQRKQYHTGSIYDLPLVVSMLWFGWVAWQGRHSSEFETQAMPPGGEYRVLAARTAMLGILSIPVVVGWSWIYSSAPPSVKGFRFIVSLAAMFLMGAMLLWKQHLTDREMIRLLQQSEESLRNTRVLQAQLVQSEKLASIGSLVAGAAHEINNPLTAIMGYSELIATDETLPTTTRDFAGKVMQQARRTKDLVGNLLRFAKQSPSEKTAVNLNSVVESTIHLRAAEINGRKLQVERNLAADLPAVWGDPNQLMDVCVHIIGNAIDALEKQGGGLLKIKTWSESGQAVLEFSDNGPGVVEPKRVFDPFYTTKPVGKGTGLGLSACYGILKEHNGEIQCTNRPEGGAVFTIRLPLIAPAEPKQEVPPEEVAQ